jgi:hypothetical protein
MHYRVQDEMHQIITNAKMHYISISGDLIGVIEIIELD